MAGFDRQAAPKGAEKAHRQGRLGLAIKEYARVVENDARDWNEALDADERRVTRSV
jgi:hypothetical protein